MKTAPPPPICDPANSLLSPLVEILRRAPKRVVFPEGNDPRILRVAAELVRLECVSPILIGRRKEIESTAKTVGVPMDFIGVVQPEDSSDFQAYCERYRRMHKIHRMVIRAPEETIAMPQYFAAMMVQWGAADAVVGGNRSYPAAFFRSLFHITQRLPHLDSATSCLPVWLRNRPDIGRNGVLFLTDCSVVPTPTVGQLANSAVETAKVAGSILSAVPKVAFLSFSTKGTARNLSTEKMLAATQFARKLASEQRVEADIDGEIELDAALLPGPAEQKAPNSLVAGRANVLVFPDLNSSHIAYKLLEHIAGAECYGQMVLGLARPAVQVSRVETETTIFGAAICAAFRALQYRDLVGNEDLEE